MRPPSYLIPTLRAKAQTVRVGAAKVTKQYVDVRGAVWELTYDPEGGTVVAESPGYRASRREAPNVDKALEAIDKLASSDRQRISRTSEETGASPEGIYKDPNDSEWTKFWYRQQSDLDPSTQTGYYAERWGSLVGPSYSSKDVEQAVRRFIERQGESKGVTIYSTSTSADKLDEVPERTSPDTPKPSQTTASKVATSSIARTVVILSVLSFSLYMFVKSLRT